MTTDEFAFDLPDDAPPDMRAIAMLGQGLSTLRAAVADLAEQHRQLRDQVAGLGPGGRGGAQDTVPGPLRWADLDRTQASTTWIRLINWVGWLTARYQLAEELPHCWAHHPPLVEELTALATAWHAAYDDGAASDAGLHWLDSLARTRSRIREWDDHTRCRNGTHNERHIDLPWPADWRDQALDVALADVATRPFPEDSGSAGRLGDQP
ncbi:hypothetical protein [Rugosimonospora africana]|uniref:DUF4913 domain-containing protein n=1 Tax=Rugosimonospora africana TaxID=556532 RepID=A0A8J3QX00_9ACTN|nr:hypothetical protein [Rugosimonospora africana]GIH18960.1 hypothetical protein Raf01_71320 [Rugosimonospora africana]